MQQAQEQLEVDANSVKAAEFAVAQALQELSSKTEELTEKIAQANLLKEARQVILGEIEEIRDEIAQVFEKFREAKSAEEAKRFVSEASNLLDKAKKKIPTCKPFSKTFDPLE